VNCQEDSTCEFILTLDYTWVFTNWHLQWTSFVTGRYHWILFENLLQSLHWGGNWCAVAMLEYKKKKIARQLLSPPPEWASVL